MSDETAWIHVLEVAKRSDAMRGLARAGVVELGGGVPFDLVATPLHFDGKPGSTRRAPELDEHRDEILGGLELDMEAILELQIEGAIT